MWCRLRTLDRASEASTAQTVKPRRFHKRSILKQHSKECKEEGDSYLQVQCLHTSAYNLAHFTIPQQMSRVNIRNNQKVKFAGSLRQVSRHVGLGFTER